MVTGDRSASHFQVESLIGIDRQTNGYLFRVLIVETEQSRAQKLGLGRFGVRLLIMILLKKSSAKNDAKIFRSQMPHNRLSRDG